MSKDCCFSKNSRLRKPTLFNQVYQNNQVSVKGQYFIVLAFFRLSAVANASVSARITPAPTHARVGVVVSKKVSKSAVRRNRIKRLMREHFRQNTHPDGFDFVVIARPSANGADNQQLVKELHYLWHKLHRRCDTV